MKAMAGMAALAAMALVAGCAGMHSVSSDVSSWGEWPAGRAPGSFAFDRLPSQQTRAAESDALEASARAALEKAGFKAAEAGKEPELLVQLGAVDGRVVYLPWDDPLWWRGGYGHWRYGSWGGPRWGWGWGWGGPGFRYEAPRYESQVALLIRDRSSGKPLFEARAASDSFAPADAADWSAMFQAALTDFPRTGAKPHRVTVPLTP